MKSSKSIKATNLGGRIRQLRQRLNMSQEELASKIGTTKQAVSKYENGIVTNVPFDRLKLIAEALEVSLLDVAIYAEMDKGDLDISVDSSGDNYTIYDRYQAPVLDCVENTHDRQITQLIEYYKQLNTAGRTEAIKRVEELTQIPKYTTPDDTDKEET